MAETEFIYENVLHEIDSYETESGPILEQKD